MIEKRYFLSNFLINQNILNKETQIKLFTISFAIMKRLLSRHVPNYPHCEIPKIDFHFFIIFKNT